MDEHDRRLSKRRRLDDAAASFNDQIDNVNQLEQSLRTQHTLTPSVTAAINQFKNFLAVTVKSEDSAESERALRVLRQYCKRQVAPSKEDLDFPDIISTWSQAVESNNNAICSAVPAALAQFYRTISSNLDFRDYGLGLGQTLLKQNQVRLFKHGLSAPKTRDRLISPCLRLLTEIVSFDGGTLANQVFNRRDFLFTRLDSLLEQHGGEVEGGRRKPSVRRMALRLLIACLKFLDSDAKTEFLSHGRIFRNCLQGLSKDGDDIVVEILNVIESGILENKAITKAAKYRILGSDNLVLLSLLYQYEEDPDHPGSDTRVRDAVHKLLLLICTKRSGIAVSQTGWYPVAFETRLGAVDDQNYIDLGLNSVYHGDEYRNGISVKNGPLSTFIQTLKPESDVLQSTLLLQILQNSPELVADYFSKKTRFVAVSADDSTWRSQFAFLYSVVQLPVPQNFGWLGENPIDPPPVSVIVENILPRPFERGSLSKYFTSNDEILVLSAARLLVVALDKLQNVLRVFETRGHAANWQQASIALLESIASRIAKMQDIINALQQTKASNETLKTALHECLASYYRVLPEVTAGSRFDIGPALLGSLSRYIVADTNSKSTTELDHQLSSILTVAQLSSSTKWWTKPDADQLSLFSKVLRFAAECIKSNLSSTALGILATTVRSVMIFATERASFEALCRCMSSTCEFEIGPQIWLLLDNAIYRAVQRPVKYLDMVESVQEAVGNNKPLSLLAAAINEQWQFLLKKHAGEKGVIENAAVWVTRLFKALENAGENSRALQHLQDEMELLTNEDYGTIFEEARAKAHGQKEFLQPNAGSVDTKDTLATTPDHDKKLDLEKLLGNLSSLPLSLEGNDRWNAKTDFELVIQSGKLGSLIKCAASPEEEVRRQAYEYLQGLVHLVEESTYEESKQLYLLLGEVVQTLRQQGFASAIPSMVAELAIRLLDIIADPAHKMYGKTNEFLLRSPVWDAKSLLLYWTRNILYRDPESDLSDAWTSELEWLLELLGDGLKTKTDMELYRQSGILEKILAIYTKPGLARLPRRLILTLLWRYILIGGADTLITRVGVQSWLQGIAVQDKDHYKIIQQLQRELHDASNADDIGKWANDLPILRSGDDKTNHAVV